MGNDKRHQDNLGSQQRSEIGRKGGETQAQDSDMGELGQKGGQTSGGQFEENSERTEEAARKGGQS